MVRLSATKSQFHRRPSGPLKLENKRYANFESNMIVFSRGCCRILRPLQCPNQFLTSTLKSPPPRFFRTNAPFNASLKARSNAKPKNPSITITKSSKNRTSSEPKLNTNRNTASSPSASQATYISHLASKGTPTLLYTAPSHSVYTIGCYSGALFCLSYTGYVYESVVVHGPEDLSTWVVYTFTGICFFTAAIGGYLLLGPNRIIQKIMAVPRPRPTSVPGGGQSHLLTAISNDTSPLNLEIHFRSFIPKFLSPKLPAFITSMSVVKAAPSAVTLSQPLSPLLLDDGRTPLTPEEKRKKKEEAEERKRKWRTSIMTRPFQAMSQGARTLWEGMKRVITREGFVELGVRGKGTYKLDVRGGWMLVQGGKGSLDRVCNIRKA